MIRSSNTRVMLQAAGEITQQSSKRRSEKLCVLLMRFLFLVKSQFWQTSNFQHATAMLVGVYTKGGP